MAYNATEEIAAAANYPQIRLFTAALNGSINGTVPDLLGVNQYWSVASPTSIGGGAAWDYFSATCWFFGRDLANALSSFVPLGLFVSCWGGTNVQAWSSPDSLKQCGWINPPAVEDNSAADRRYLAARGPPINPDVNPSSLYNSMIFPLMNMTIKGVIWYQGESNADPPNPNNAANYSAFF